MGGQELPACVCAQFNPFHTATCNPSALASYDPVTHLIQSALPVHGEDIAWIAGESKEYFVMHSPSVTSQLS